MISNTPLILIFFMQGGSGGQTEVFSSWGLLQRVSETLGGPSPTSLFPSFSGSYRQEGAADAHTATGLRQRYDNLQHAVSQTPSPFVSRLPLAYAAI